MMTTRQILLLALPLLLLFAVASSVFMVNEKQTVALFQFGEILQTDFEPGLHFKVPFVQKVRRFDDRILTLDGHAERFLTSEKKNVEVDFYVKWRIEDVAAYYKATGGDTQRALLRLSDIIRKGLRREFGKRTIQQVVSGERTEIMQGMIGSANQRVSDIGIQIVDVRIKRIDLPSEVAGSVYQRMRSERERVAAELRAKGAEEGEKIRANADKQRTVILADAYETAQELRGAGDAKAASIYAAAYKKSPPFAAFYLSLNAYESSFDSKQDLLVLDPNGEFFKYFNPDSK